MKKHYCLILSLLFILNGCTTLLIKVYNRNDKNGIMMFGNTSERNFYVRLNLSDSLKYLWEAGTHGSFANTSVTINDSIIFVGDLAGRVYAFNYVTGKEVGQIKEKGAVFGAPVIYNSKLVYAMAANNDNETTFFMYDLNLGKISNQEVVKGRVLNEIVETENGFVTIAEDGNVYNFNRNGIVQWNVKLNSKVHSSSAFSSGIVFLGNDKGEIIGIQSRNGEVLYRKNVDGLFLSGASISGESVFIGNDNGYLYAFDLKSGDLLWKFNSKFRISMTPAYDDEHIYFGNLNGDFFCLNKSNGKLIWKYHSPGVFNITPLVSNNYLFVPDLANCIRIIDKKNGKLDKTLELEGRPKLTPVFYNNRLIIGFDKGTLQTYEFIY